MNPVCLSENVLSQMASGLLPEPALSLALIHIDECEICQERMFEAIKQSGHRITQLPSKGDSLDIHEKLEELNRRRAEILREKAQVLEERSNFGPFQITRLIHSGLMSQVYEAFDPRLNRQIVLKILDESFVKNEPALANRFLEEARIVAQIKNPHVVIIYDVGIDHDRPYIVMPKLEGESLRSRLTRGPISLVETIRLVQMLIKGLKAAHQLGVIHRDLKPENLWLEPDENDRDHLVILDFGIAQFVTEPSQGMSGTPSYWSPEQVLNLGVDERTDFFAVGCLLFEMVTGRSAWATDVSDEFRNPLMDSNLPEILVPVLIRMMTLEAWQRYEDHESILADLATVRESVLAGKTVRSGRFIPMTVGSVLILLLLLFLLKGNVVDQGPDSKSLNTNATQGKLSKSPNSVFPIRFAVDQSTLQLKPGSPISVSANGLLMGMERDQTQYSLFDISHEFKPLNRLQKSETLDSVRLSESGRFAAALRNDNVKNGYFLQVWKMDPERPHEDVEPVWSSLFRERTVHDYCWQEFEGSVFLVLSMDLNQIQIYSFSSSTNDVPKLSRLNYEFSFIPKLYSKPGDSILLGAKHGGGVDIFDLRNQTLKFSYRIFESGPPLVDWNPNGYGMMVMDSEGNGVDYDLRIHVGKNRLGQAYLRPLNNFDIKTKASKTLFLDQDHFAVLCRSPGDRIVLFQSGTSVQVTSIEFKNNEAVDMFVIKPGILGVIDRNGIFRKVRLEIQNKTSRS